MIDSTWTTAYGYDVISKRAKIEENDQAMMTTRRTVRATPETTSAHPAWAALLRLDRAVTLPLQRQIYERLRAAIDTRMLRPGERIASARGLASELGVARGTVEAAYQQLAGEGYLLARGQAGTIVSPHLPDEVPRQSVSRTRNTGRRTQRASVAQLDFTPAAEPLPFQLGIPALGAFPRKLWSRLGARRLRSQLPAELFYGDPSGHAPLRQALAAYLLVSRGIACRPEQVFVTAGYRASLGTLARTLLVRGDRVWIENPGYPPTRDVLERGGYRAVSVDVDREGLVVARGLRRAPRAKMAVVTPSHQAPLGVSMTMPRRLQLLDWAARAGAWIVEDDYDGEYRYSGPPLPALKSLDARDRVIYAGSFSKTLYPGLALGYVVVPEPLVERYADTLRAESNGCPPLIQAIVADFIADGHFSRHLKKMRLLYARRRETLANALVAVFGDQVSIELQAGGMHLIARFATRRSDRVLAAKAQQAGLNCQPLSERVSDISRNARRRHEGERVSHHQGLLMGFTNIATAAHAKRLCVALRQAIG